MASSDNIDALVEQMREKCLAKGCGGIKHLSSLFRRLDMDCSRRVNFEELRQGLILNSVPMREDDIKALFESFDVDASGQIDFNEFLKKLRPPMTQGRIRVVDEAFDKLDANGDGVLKLDDLRVVYSENAEKHPKVMSGEMSVDEILRQFLDTMDTPGCPDGRVTREEFHLYYAGVSSGIDDDCYFDLTMRSCFGLPPRGHSK